MCAGFDTCFDSEFQLFLKYASIVYDELVEMFPSVYWFEDYEKLYLSEKTLLELLNIANQLLGIYAALEYERLYVATQK